MRHKHCEVIKAWADGKTVQTKTGPYWFDVKAETPTWENKEYRVKPEVLMYRVALFSGRLMFSSVPENQNGIENSPNFNRWLTDWVEVEV